MVVANGAHLSAQSFVLAQGATGAGRPFWSGTATKGFTYKDPKGEQGAVKSVNLKRSSRGTFPVKVAVSGKGGPVSVLPPDPGTDGCAALTLGQTPGAGDRYSLLFGPESTIKNSGDELFSAQAPTAKGICAPPSGEVAFPTCGGTCPGGDACGPIQDVAPPQCTCFPAARVCGDVPGGGVSVMCNPSTQDCGQLAATAALSLAGSCPPGAICTAGFAQVFACGPMFQDLCAVIEATCLP